MTVPRDCAEILLGPPPVQVAFARWLVDLPVRHGWRGRTCRDIWDKAPEPSWLLTYARRADVPDGIAMRAAVACARLAMPHVSHDQRGFASRALRAAERWGDEPTERRRAAATRAAHRLEASHRIDESDPSWRAARAAMWTALGRTPAAVSEIAALSDLVGDSSLRSGCLAIIRDMIPFVDLPMRVRR